MAAFRDRWERLLRSRGIPEIEEELAELFDESPVQWAVKELIERQVIRPRGNQTLGVKPGSGGLGVAAMGSDLLVRPNTFFGDGQNAITNDRSP